MTKDMTKEKAARLAAEDGRPAKRIGIHTVHRGTELSNCNRRELFGRFLTFCIGVSAAVGSDAAVDSLLRLKDRHNRVRRAMQ